MVIWFILEILKFNHSEETGKQQSETNYLDTMATLIFKATKKKLINYILVYLDKVKISPINSCCKF